jgi:hypothetical protein
VNILVSGNSGLTVASLAALGARRISVGSALSRAAWGGFIRAATAIAEKGSFEGLEEAASFAELNSVFGAGQFPSGWPRNSSNRKSLSRIGCLCRRGLAFHGAVEFDPALCHRLGREVLQVGLISIFNEILPEGVIRNSTGEGIS